MDFETPTTKSEMYQTLKDIYHYYRIQRNGYEPIQFEDLELTRLEFIPLTDLELRSKAADLVAASQEKDKLKRKENLQREKDEFTEKLSALNEKEQELVDAITNRYLASENKVEAEAVKNGFANSSIVVDKLTELENSKNAEISVINLQYADKRTEYSAKITSLTAEIANISNYYAQVFSAEVTEKFLELKDAQEKTEFSVIKYNGMQDEKEQKQQISTALANAELQVKFLSLQSNSFTKEQLVDMGYYDDIMDCIKGYYNSLPPAEAYEDFLGEEKLVFYLEDFYTDVLYLYRAIATD